MKVLVTGGAGFIGSKVVALLLDKGHNVRIIDNLSTGHKSLINPKAEFINADMRDFAAVDAATKDCQAVIHFAAQAIVPESVKDPLTTFEINLVGGQNLLEGIRRHKINKLVFSSTCATYGVPTKMPMAEDDPKLPISPYGATKLAFEQLIQGYHASYGLQATIFRYFNPYGPFEVHQPETHAVPNFIKATLSGQPIPLFWNGQQERDFFYVYDLAEAHVLGLDFKGYDHFNLGSGKSTKVIDLVELIFKLTGKRAAINDLGERPGDPPKLWASIDKAKTILGWQPKTDLETGLKQTIAYFKGSSPTSI